MKQTIASLTATVLLATSAQAACFADYKAKQDNPLRLHYGVIELLEDCSLDGAALEISERIKQDGWTLLAVLDVFEENGLDERRANAGEFYLRY